MASEQNMLMDLLNQLKEAIDQEDWDAAKQSDENIKSGIQKAILNAQSESEKSSLVDLLNRIQSLYKLLITNTEESRAKLSSELKKISNDKKAANFYLKSSQYR